MPKATKDELEWAYAISKEKFLTRISDLIPVKAEIWKRFLDNIFKSIAEDKAPIYDENLNSQLEEIVSKYLHPSDDYISLTDIARKFDSRNPGYLIQSWLRSRKTVEFLAEWEQNNNPKFDEQSYLKLVKDVRSQKFTLTPKKWIDATNAIGITSKQGKGGGTMAHPFIACDFEMWNDSSFRFEVIKCFLYGNEETHVQ